MASIALPSHAPTPDGSDGARGHTCVTGVAQWLSRPLFPELAHLGETAVNSLVYLLIVEKSVQGRDVAVNKGL